MRRNLHSSASSSDLSPVSRFPIIFHLVFQKKHSLFIIPHVPGILFHMRQPGVQAVIQSNCKILLLKKAAPYICRPIYMEQLLSQKTGIIRAQKSRLQIIKHKGVFPVFFSKKTLCTVCLFARLKLHAPAESSSLPRNVMLSVIFLQRSSGRDRKAVKHRPDKCGKRRFSPSILRADPMESLLKIHIKIMQFSKIFNM